MHQKDRKNYDFPSTVYLYYTLQLPDIMPILNAFQILLSQRMVFAVRVPFSFLCDFRVVYFFHVVFQFFFPSQPNKS